MTRRRQDASPEAGGRRDPYVKSVLASIQVRRLAAEGDRLLVAASAGPDSTALLGAVAALRDAGALGPVTALHVDHGLRAGVDAEVRVLRRTCHLLRVPLRCVRVVVGAGNVQAAARRARYRALREEAARVGATRIATGHTRTDQAETVLLRLARGAGARGLSGIPARRGPVIRPLIDLTRQAGLDFLARTGLEWCDDPTNATPRYARNRLRQQLWPALLELNPGAEAALARTADLLRDDERTLAGRARRLVERGGGGEGGGGIALDALRRAPRPIQRRAVRRLAKLAGATRPPEAAHVERVLRLVASGRRGVLELPGGLRARLAGGRLVVGRAERHVVAPEVAVVEVARPGRYEVPALGAVVEIAATAAAAAALAWPLRLRTRRPGDTFRPAGGRGGKKLKAWLIDRKVAQARRDGLLLLVDARGQVLAIPALGATSDLLPDGVAVRLAPRR